MADAPSTFLEGKTAVVTGGGRGIGRATAIALAAAGASRIAILARTATQLDDAVAAITAAGTEAIPIQTDLLDHDVLAATADQLISTLGGVDVLVNNAATVAPLGPSDRLDPDLVLDAFRLNVIAPLALTARLVPGMVERGWGRIVNVSSSVAAHPAGMIGGSTYSATKAALEAQTLSLAAEYGGTGVTINAYRPGGVDTAMQEWIRDQDPAIIGRELHDRFVHSRDTGRLLTPEDSGRALVAHLRSEDTGAIWDVADQL